MDIKKTALERAFELARSGSSPTVAIIKKRLDREGYASSQVQGRELAKQLKALIQAANEK